MISNRIPVVLAALVVTIAFTATPAAAEDPNRSFRIEIERIVTLVDCATRRVVGALERKDWAGWCAAHQAYVHTLERATADIEQANTRYVFGILQTGKELDACTQGAIVSAAEIAGTYTRRRVIANTYAALTRQGIPASRRAEAMTLLLKQAVYSPSCHAAGRLAATANVNPLCGRVPGTPEAAQYLQKWQYAVLRVTSSSTELKRLEERLQTMQVHNPNRADLTQELAAAKAEHAQLLKAVDEWRTKYFAAGGR